MATAITTEESTTVVRSDSVVAESVTGTISRIENGFCNPPVSANRNASCRMS